MYVKFYDSWNLHLFSCIFFYNSKLYFAKMPFLFSQFLLFFLLIQLSLYVEEFKHKSSHRSSVRCLPSAQGNVTEISRMQPVARKVQVDMTFNDKGLCRASRTVSGMRIQPKYYISSPNNNLKNSPTVKSYSGMSDFNYQLVRSAKRSALPKMGLTSTNCSLSEKMSFLRQPRHGDNHQNQNRISALNRRNKIVNPRGAAHLLSKDKVHEHLNSSLERHSQALLSNALIREKQLCCSDILNQKEPEQLWSSAYSESEKMLWFSSGDSIDDLQVSSSSDTSDSFNLSSLGVIDGDEWNTTFKRVCTRIYDY
jgi:hypothetical protein